MYHKGEIEAQEKTGEQTIAERNGRMVTNKIIPGAINFIEKQSFFITCSKSNTGEITVSALAGKEGYVKVRDESTIEIDKALVCSNPHDRFWLNITECKSVGFLFIEPATRRRFRVNGSIISVEDKLTLFIDQAYPNCPKYIQQRYIEWVEMPIYNGNPITGSALNADLKNIIESADTLFVGSCNTDDDMDASHRGGMPGFVAIKDERTLVIPDYAGNSMFNTLGNFIVNPRAGLLFIDFHNKKSLQLFGDTEIIWNKPDNELITGGTNRFWILHIKKWILMENLKGFDWKFAEYSRFNPV